MKKKIHIIGCGLYGAILAYKFAKQNYEVTMIEKSKKAFSNFKPVNILSYKLNNGFHGIEYPRAKELIDFFKKKIGVKLCEKENIRKLIIDDFLIDTNTKFDEFPDKISKIFKKKNLKSIRNQNLGYFFKSFFLKKIKKNLDKFSFDHRVSKRYIIPWFLPAETQILLEDEGMKFREAVRKGETKPKYFFPENFIFDNISKKLKRKLVQLNVKFLLSTEVRFKYKEIEYIRNNKKLNYDYDNVLHFHCSSSISILQEAQPNMLNDLKEVKRFFFNILFKIPRNSFNLKFSEILSLNYKMTNVNRISIPNNLLTKKYLFLQLECISIKDKILNSEIEVIKKELKKILKLEKIDYVGHRNTRLLFYPSDKWIRLARKECTNFLKQNRIKLITKNYFYPINMSKAWIWANEDFLDYK